MIAPPAGTPRSRAAVQASILVAMSALGAAVAAYFTATGRWTDLWTTLVVHNRYYAGPLLPNLREGLRPSRLFPPPARRDASARRPRARPRARARHAMVAPGRVPRGMAADRPGGDRRSGQVLSALLPALAAALVHRGRVEPGRARRAHAHLPAAVTAAGGAAVALALAFEVGPAYALSAADWSDTKYGDVFLRSRDIADEVRGMIGPGETIFQWGNEPEIYVYARRSPPSGVLWAQHMQTGPLRNSLRSRALAQLSVADPQLVVLGNDQPPPRAPSAPGSTSATSRIPRG